MEMKLKAYIDHKFFVYPKTKEIIEVRDELYSMMLDKYRDCQERGLSKDKSYELALTILEDYKSAIKEVETGSSFGALKKKLISSLAFSAFYFIALACVYLYVSMVTLNSFDQTWLIFVGGTFIYFIYFSVNMMSYAKMFDMKVLTRCFMGALFLSTIPLLYVFPSLLLSVLYEKSIWKYSWLVIPVIAFIYLLADLIIFAKNQHKLMFDLQLIATGFVLTTIVYLSIAFLFDLWNLAWIVYVAYLSIVALVFYISEKFITRKN